MENPLPRFGRRGEDEDLVPGLANPLALERCAMERLKRFVLLIPALMALIYAAVVGAEAAYVGLLASADSLSGHGFDPSNEQWRFRSRGHYFWYGAAVSAAFSLVGVGLKRVLAPKSNEG